MHYKKIEANAPPVDSRVRSFLAALCILCALCASAVSLVDSNSPPQNTERAQRVEMEPGDYSVDKEVVSSVRVTVY
jgi:succinate dehydrogenase/fumarate reductase-like Fe-S protein